MFAVQLFTITPEPARVTTTEARLSVDDLVAEAWQYRRSADFRELLEFVGGFRFQAPFNALLLHIQRPGATYVETARRWRERYGRVVKAGERPLVVLWTFWPVMFVYDPYPEIRAQSVAQAPTVPGEMNLCKQRGRGRSRSGCSRSLTQPTWRYPPERRSVGHPRCAGELRHIAARCQ